MLLKSSTKEAMRKLEDRNMALEKELLLIKAQSKMQLAEAQGDKEKLIKEFKRTQSADDSDVSLFLISFLYTLLASNLLNPFTPTDGISRPITMVRRVHSALKGIEYVQWLYFTLALKGLNHVVLPF